MCLAQQVQGQGVQLTRCLPTSYGSGAVATDGPFCLTPVLCGLPFFSLKTKKHQIEFDSFCQKVLMLGVKFQGSGYNELQHFSEILLV